MAEDWSRDPEAQKWLRQVLDDMAPKLESSAVCVSLVPGGKSVGDAKYWVELGASIMMDKPLLVVVSDDRPLPERLIRVADAIVRLDHPVDDPRGAKQLTDAIERLLPPDEGRQDG